MARTLKTVLSNSSNSGYPVFFLLSRKCFVFSPLRMMFALGLSYMVLLCYVFYVLSHVLCIIITMYDDIYVSILPIFWRAYHKWALNLNCPFFPPDYPFFGIHLLVTISYDPLHLSVVSCYCSFSFIMMLI